MGVFFHELPDSPQVITRVLIAAADKDAYERIILGSAHEFAPWLRAVDVQFVQPEDEPGESPARLVAVVLYQPDRDRTLFPDAAAPA